LQPSDHVIEIGTGWGTFAMHAAGKYGCRVTTTTISDEQFRMATDRVQAVGLSDRVTILKKDYRDLEGRFDKLVSIEMIEAVGKKYLPGYFETCDRLLKDDGAMLIQAIILPEQRYAGYEEAVDFIQKYIFPGGFLPSISMMQKYVTQSTPLRMLALDDFGLHYARTLRLWNERFHERLDDVRALGFGERFIRMWRYYLCYCEAAFLERAIGLVQVLWAKPGSTLGSA
jgi:cyclopropane-fatty-acyl-phospholipid synthase